MLHHLSLAVKRIGYAALASGLKSASVGCFLLIRS